MIHPAGTLLLFQFPKIGSRFFRSRCRARSFLAVLFLMAALIPSPGQNRDVTGTSPTLARIQWKQQTGVMRYRLQIASDRQFNDVLFDGVVSRPEYFAKDFGPGLYYWRVAAAESLTRRFLAAGRLEVRAANVARQLPASSSPAASKRRVVSSWLAATGEIFDPIVAPLRNGAQTFVGTNSEGTTYALNSTGGTALWSARYLKRDIKADNPRGELAANSGKVAGRQLIPVIVDWNNATLVIVRSEKGLRALEAFTGQEIWSTQLEEGIAGAVVADLDGEPGPEIYATDSTSNRLLCLDASTGKVKSESKLTGKPMGPPVLLSTVKTRALLVPLESNSIDIRSGEGLLIRTLRMGSDLTTAPVVAETSRGVMMLVGTKDGLVYFETSRFQPLGRIAAGGGAYPTGSLAVADLNGDRKTDVVIMITNSDRVTAIDPSDGKVKWVAEGFGLAAAAVFADLNGDGWLDVLLPGKDTFAVALSGVDGARIWDSSEAGENIRTARLPAQATRLATATMIDGRIIVVGNDATGIGLRAMELRNITTAVK